MTIIVYGMGIIGGSIAASLKQAGHRVFGRNRSEEPLRYAQEHGMIDGTCTSFEGADVVFLALPPKVAIDVLTGETFPEGSIVCDICGVKAPVEKAVHLEKRAYRYVGTHPMAGKETTGIRSASAALFQRANFVITSCAETDPDALSVVRGLARDMGFARIVECGAEEHDRMIALTSQLAHIVSSAYIRTPLAGSCVGFTGGSFQDMTRVAPMDDVWAELFLLNREALLPEIDRLIGGLSSYREALFEGDREKLLEQIRAGKAFYDNFCAQNRRS